MLAKLVAEVEEAQAVLRKRLTALARRQAKAAKRGSAAD